MLKKFRDWIKYDDGGSTLFIIGFLILVLIFIWRSVVYKNEHYYTETSQMIVEVLGKDTDTYTTYTKAGNILVPHTHHRYYLMWEEEKWQVSQTIYDESNIGDRFVIEVASKYERGTDNLVDVNYVYVNQ